MRGRWIALVAGQLCGLLLFFRGFFLTRYEMTSRSDCSSPPGDPSAASADGRACWTPGRPKFGRAVILVIDALRYDFLRSNVGSRAALTPSSDDDEPPYLHRLPVVRDLLRDAPQRTLLYPFTADPPTVTMQRLKGLTTGGLPTFIDASSNFASPAVEEDSIVSQLLDAGRRIVFMGDDTWDALFPNAFLRSYPFPSFDVKDLHTVDDGIGEHLLPEIRDKDDWDVVVAHFLGVDHVGHRFGPSHPAMAAKLAQMDGVVRSVADALPDDCSLW
jgi:phosphatidylinositol glycan class O